MGTREGRRKGTEGKEGDCKLVERKSREEGETAEKLLEGERTQERRKGSVKKLEEERRHSLKREKREHSWIGMA